MSKKTKQHSVFDEIEKMLANGSNPEEIMNSNPSYRKWEKIIRDAYIAKTKEASPCMRDVEVYWHYGNSDYKKNVMDQILERYGENDVFFLNSYKNNSFTKYHGEKCLVLENFKGQWPYCVSLNILDVYTKTATMVMLWNEVHIFSPLLPDEAYKKEIDYNNINVFNINQLMRRITAIVYHYKDIDGKPNTYLIPPHVLPCETKQREKIQSLLDAKIDFSEVLCNKYYKKGEEKSEK